MSLKYRVIHANGQKDFLDQNEASIFAQSVGAPIDVIPNSLQEDTLQIINTNINNKAQRIQKIMQNFRDENIIMGITASGKSAEVLGLVMLPITIPNCAIPISLAAALQFDTLTVAIQILQVHLDNIASYSHLTPYITYDRILKLKNDISDVI